MSRNRIGIIFVLMVSFLGSSNVYGQSTSSDGLQLNTITTAVPFLLIAPDSRSGGMGEVGGALSPTSNSIHWNTSMLAFAPTDQKFELGFSYTPWLRNLVSDMHLAYLSGFGALGKEGRHIVGGAVRYFNLGEITFTDGNGQVIRPYNPNEFAITGSYVFKLNPELALGLNGSFIYSNLTGGYGGVSNQGKAGIAGAVDFSFSWYKQDLELGDKDGKLGLGFIVSNIGNKISYTDQGQADFLPTNLRLASSLQVFLDEYNSLTVSLDLNKLLVPTPPIYGDDPTTPGVDNVIISGKDPNVGVMQGMIQSFYDAPGVPITDDQGNYVKDADGTFEVEKGTKFKEELSEINIAFGLEYWYQEYFALRTGVFYESPNKGARQFMNFGFGVQYKSVGLDFSYLLALTRNNPLANTLRFGLYYKFKQKTGSSDDPSEL